MALMNTLQKKWNWLVNTTNNAESGQLLEELRVQYYAETQDAALFAAHAGRMYYPQFRDRLLRIAAEEHAHARWLREQIHALGGDVAPSRSSLEIGHNSWECLLLDLENERRSCVEFGRLAQTAMLIDPELADGLQRICVEERRHHEELREMWMKSDPYTPPVLKEPHPELEQQKQAWLDRQKGQWFAQEQAEWEAAGRPFAWAEWEGEIEKRWTVNELPSLELRWARHVADVERSHTAHAVRKPALQRPPREKPQSEARP